MTKCHFCGGTVRPAIVETVQNYQGRIVAFENVPAEQCEQCGEKYYKGWVLDEMDRLAKSNEPGKREIRVPVHEISHELVA